MNERLQDALEVCLAAMHIGASPENCFRLFPDLASELRPMVYTLQSARLLAVQELPPGAIVRSRSKLLSRAAQSQFRGRPFFSDLTFDSFSFRLAFTALAVIVALILSWNGLVGVSAHSLPGDPLYSVKRVAEQVNLQLAPNIESKHTMETTYNRRRADEIKNLFHLGRVEHISLEGVVSEMNSDRWIVDGIPVTLTPQTHLIGDIQPGRVIEVEGQTHPEGWIIANELHLRYFEVSGQVDSISPNQWTISGNSLSLHTNVQIDPGLKVGDPAVALIHAGDDNRLTALAIVSLPSALSPAPTFMPFEITFSGIVEAIQGDLYTINGKKIWATQQTEITKAFAIGDQVEVSAWVAADGSLTAQKISLVSHMQGNQEDQLQSGDTGQSGNEQQITPDTGSDQSSLGEDSGDDSGGQHSGTDHSGGGDDHGGDDGHDD